MHPLLLLKAMNLEDILMDSAALRTEGVVTYAELCAKRRARREIYQNYMNLEDILRKNCRTRPKAVESYCERERSAIVTKIYPNQRPVEPKPPSPLTVSESSSHSSNSTLRNGTIASWATRSPASTVASISE